MIFLAITAQYQHDPALRRIINEWKSTRKKAMVRKKRHKKTLTEIIKKKKEMRELKIDTVLFGLSFNRMRLFHSSIKDFIPSHKINVNVWCEKFLNGLSNHVERVFPLLYAN